MKDIRDLCPESGPLVKMVNRHVAGTPFGYTHEKMNRMTKKNMDEFALVIWRMLLKRRAPDYVIAAVTKWRHTLEKQKGEST